MKFLECRFSNEAAFLLKQRQYSLGRKMVDNNQPKWTTCEILLKRKG